jgi:hypothetical protein
VQAIEDVQISMDGMEMPDLPPRSEDADMAALDMLRVLAEALVGLVAFRKDPGSNIERASHEEGTSYRISLERGTYQAVIESQTIGGAARPDELLYEGKDAADAAGWCRIHAAYGHLRDPGFRSMTGPFRTSDGYTILCDPGDGAWRLLSPENEDLGAWQTPRQAELVALAFKAAS